MLARNGQLSGVHGYAKTKETTFSLHLSALTPTSSNGDSGANDSYNNGRSTNRASRSRREKIYTNFFFPSFGFVASAPGPCTCIRDAE